MQKPRLNVQNLLDITEAFANAKELDPASVIIIAKVDDPHNPGKFWVHVLTGGIESLETLGTLDYAYDIMREEISR